VKRHKGGYSVHLKEKTLQTIIICSVKTLSLGTGDISWGNGKRGTLSKKNFLSTEGGQFAGEESARRRGRALAFGI